jgi:hypothetical protein
MMKLFTVAVLLLAISVTAHAQNEYVKPGQVVEKNKAPGMKVKLLKKIPGLLCGIYKL